MDKIDKVNEMTAEQAKYYRLGIRDCWILLFNQKMELIVPGSVECKINNLENRVIKRLVKLGELPKYRKCKDPDCTYPAKMDGSKCCEHEEKELVRTRVFKKRGVHEFAMYP